MFLVAQIKLSIYEELRAPPMSHQYNNPNASPIHRSTPTSCSVSVGTTHVHGHSRIFRELQSRTDCVCLSHKQPRSVFRRKVCTASAQVQMSPERRPVRGRWTERNLHNDAMNNVRSRPTSGEQTQPQTQAVCRQPLDSVRCSCRSERRQPSS